MDEYDWVEKIEISQLSNKALVLVSRFARVLKQVNGQILSLRDPMLARKLLLHIKLNDDPRLLEVFESLIVEFKAIETSDNTARVTVPSKNEHQPSSDAQATKSRMTYRGATIE